MTSLWSNYEKTHAINHKELTRKISVIDYPTLISTVRTMAEDLHNNPIVTLDDEGLMDLLDSCDGKTPGDFMMNDFSLLLKVLNNLAFIIVSQHLSELAHVKTGKQSKSPLEHLSVSPSFSRITFSVRSRGAHDVHLHPVMETKLQNLIDYVVLPEGSWYYRTVGYYMHSASLGKIVIDLLSLDDYGLDTVRTYTASQHDWALSSMGGLLKYSRDYNRDGINTKYKRNLICMIITSLLYGCQNNEGPKDMIMLDRLGVSHLVGDGFSLTNVIRLIDSVMGTSGTIINSRFFDGEIVNFSLSHGTRNEIVRVYGYDAVASSSEAPEDRIAHSSYRRPLPFDPNHEPAYIRFYNSIMPLSIKSNSITGQAMRRPGVKDIDFIMDDLPEDLLQRITRQRVIDLERKTKFIITHLTKSIFNYPECAIALTGRRLGVQDPVRNVHEVALQEHATFRDRCVPYMVEPPEEDLLGLCFIRHRIEESADRDDNTRRLQSFVKLYAIHHLVRATDDLSDQDVTVTPLDSIIISDVISALDACYSQGTIMLDKDSSIYGRLTDVCMRICASDEWSWVESGEWPMDNASDEDANEDVSGLYKEMSRGGCLEQLEETFQKLDDALINTVIDYYVGYKLHADESDMPGEFVLESLKMDAMDGYEKATDDLTVMNRVA